MSNDLCKKLTLYFSLILASLCLAGCFMDEVPSQPTPDTDDVPKYQDRSHAGDREGSRGIGQ